MDSEQTHRKGAELPNYELTYIVRPLDEANLTAVHDRVGRIISAAGGEITARNDMGRRHLAYPIRKINEGQYYSLTLNLPPTAVTGLERQLQLTDEVLRYLVVKIEQAQSAPVATAPAAAAAAPAPAPAPATEPTTPPAEPSAPPAPAERS